MQFPDFGALWQKGARMGVHTQSYPSMRRISLINQMAMLSMVISAAYSVGAAVYAPLTLWPIVVIMPPMVIGYIAVLRLNARQHHVAAQLLLITLPSVHIVLACWMLGTQVNAHLYFFVLWAAGFLLYDRSAPWLTAIAVTGWVGLYLLIQLTFTTPLEGIQVSSGFMQLASFVNTLGAFVLTGAVISLFYVEINRTEDKLRQEHRRSEELLRNILPDTVADRLKDGNRQVADGFAEATLLFADIVGFTRLSRDLRPHEVVDLLNLVFSRFDRLVEARGLEKIKTIGDEYMLAGGLPVPRRDHAQAVADAALEMLDVIEQLNQQMEHKLSLRVGINTGEVVAGVIGSRKFSYDVWGDTVNTANRMQSQGMAGRIQVTRSTYERLQYAYEFKQRGTIRVRGRGRMPTYWLLGRKPGIADSD